MLLEFPSYDGTIKKQRLTAGFFVPQIFPLVTSHCYLPKKSLKFTPKESPPVAGWPEFC